MSQYVRYPQSGGGGGAAWGAITGTLADQVDLQAALDDKFSINPNGGITLFEPGGGSGLISLELETLSGSYTITLPGNPPGDNTALKHNSGGNYTWAAAGDASGPASSVDNTVAVFDSTTGKLLKQGTGMTVNPSTGTTVMLPSGYPNSVEVKNSAIVSRNSLTLRDNTAPTTNFIELTPGDSFYAYTYLAGQMHTWWFQNAGNDEGLHHSLVTKNTTHVVDMWVKGATYGADAGTFNIRYNGTTSAILTTSGELQLVRAGQGVSIKEGANCRMGQATLVAGTVTVSTTAVTANSRIFLTCAVVGGTQGILSVGTITAGVSFVINSNSVIDTSTVNWLIFEPSP